MAIVYKYPIKYGQTDVPGAKSSKVLGFGQQDRDVVAWVLHKDPDNLDEDVIRLQLVFTGEEFDDDWYVHVATTTLDTGLVVHLFERKRF